MWLTLAAILAGGCSDPCVETIGRGLLVQEAQQYEIDVYGAGVGCAGASAAAGAPAPKSVRTYRAGDKISFDVSPGEHTIVITAFDASNAPLGSACQSGRFGPATHVCLSLVLTEPPDLGVCTGGACACAVDTDCASDRYCAASGLCEPGCRTNGDCMSAGGIDGGQTVALPLCDGTRHVCVACTQVSDCIRPPVCQDNVSVSYPAQGSPCVAGACVYPLPTVMSCPSGCYGGACTGPLAAVENVRAVEAGTQTVVDLAVALGAQGGGGNAASTRDVEVLLETRPRGAAKTVTLSYFLNGNFSSAMTATASPIMETGADSILWSGTLPKQPVGTQVYFYATGTGWDGTTLFAPGSQRNFTYKSN